MGADPSLVFGKLLVKAGLFTEPEVEDLLKLQREAAERGETTTLGEICLGRGLLTSRQVKRIEEAQAFYELRQEDRRIGELAVEQGLATQKQVDLALEEQKRLHEGRAVQRLGEILVGMGVLSQGQLTSLLTAQGDHRDQPPPLPAARGQTSPAPPQPAEGEEPTGWLVQEAGEGAGARFPLARKAVLGRQPHSEVPLADEKASREHARVEFYPHSKQHVIFDLGSTNGTLVNGQPLSEPRALLPKDKIQIGETVLRYEPGECVQVGFIPPGRTVVASWAEMAARATSETEALRRSRKEEEPQPSPTHGEQEEPAEQPATTERNAGVDSGTWMPGVRPEPTRRAEKTPGSQAVPAIRGERPLAAAIMAASAAAATRPAPVARPHRPRTLAISLCAALVLGALGIAYAVLSRPAARDQGPSLGSDPRPPAPVAAGDPGTQPRADEAAALSCIKRLVAVEAARKQDGKDYLVDSVWLLYYGRDARGGQLQLVPKDYAQADLARLGVKATPYRGYYLSAMRCDENGIPFENLKNRRFAFCVWPAQYGAGAILTFIAGEGGVVWRKDLSGGGPVRQWPATDPLEEGWVRAE